MVKNVTFLTFTLEMFLSTAKVSDGGYCVLINSVFPSDSSTSWRVEIKQMPYSSFLRD